MQSIQTAVGTTAEWVQPRATDRFYELRAGDEVLATLTFRSAFGTLAVGETTEGRWTYKRVGFLNPRVTVRIEGSDNDLAIYHPKFWGDGILDLQSGPSFAWKPTNFWGTQWAFFDAAGSVVLGFKSGVQREKLSDLFKTQFTLDIAQPAGPQGVLSILATLGMYLMILHQQDAAAAATAASASAAT